jgi:hypothetical protein
MVETGGLRSFYPSSASDMKFGAAAGDVLAAAGNGYTNTAYLRQAGADLYTQIGNGIADRDSVWTGVGTTYKMGTAGSIGYGVRAFAKLAIGDGTFNFDGARRHMTMAAEPGSGTWARGDVVYNRDPSAGGKLGWVCVVGGAPGTWKAFGTIDP